MTKDQILKRIDEAAKHHRNNMDTVSKHACEMNDYNSMVQIEAALAVGSAIADTLNNIAIILCEMLPEEE